MTGITESAAVAAALVAAVEVAKEAAEGTLALRDVQVGSVMKPKLNAVKMEARAAMAAMADTAVMVLGINGQVTLGTIALMDPVQTAAVAVAVATVQAVKVEKVVMAATAAILGRMALAAATVVKDQMVERTSMIADIAAAVMEKMGTKVAAVAFALVLGLQAAMAPSVLSNCEVDCLP